MKNLKEQLVNEAQVKDWRFSKEEILAIYSVLSLADAYVQFDDLSNILHINSDILNDLEEKFGDEAQKVIKNDYKYLDLKSIGNISKLISKIAK